MDTATFPSPKSRPNKPKASIDALELQRLLMRDARSDEVTAAVRAQLARAWVDLQEMRLRLAMKPAPKPIDVSALQKSRKKAAAPVAPEPIAPGAGTTQPS